MARPRPPDTRRRATVTAAARRIDLSDPKKAARELGKRQDWQEEAIAFANVTEVKFVNIWAGNLMAKVRLFAGAVPPGSPPDANPIPVSDPASGVSPALAKAAEAKVAALRSEIGGQGEILSRYKRNVTLVGECYLVGWGERLPRGPGIGETDGTDGSPAEFRIYSIKEVVKRGEGSGPDSGTFVLDHKDDFPGRKLEPDKGDQCIRMWLPDPMWWRLADCNMRGLLDDCRILQGLHHQAYAETLSRLNAGILLIPNGLEVVPNHPGQALEDGDEEQDKDASLMAQLEEAISGPIEDVAHPSGQTPTMVRGEADDLEKVRHLTLARTADSSLDSRIAARIERIARGLDAPVEVVMGHQQTTYANASQVDADVFEDHLEPGLLAFYDMTTVGYLRPELVKDGFDPQEVEQVQMWGDASDLIASPDTEKNAPVAHGLNVINDAAARRALGFSEDDAPDALELVTRIGAKRGILTAELTSALLRELAEDAGVEWPEIDALLPGQGQEQQAMAAVARLLALRDRKREQGRAVTASRMPKENPGMRLAAIDSQVFTMLTVAASDHLTRALDKAGARMRTKTANGMRNTIKDVPNRMVAATLGRTAALAAASEEDALAGAWDALEEQWGAWVADAQSAALGIAGGTVVMSESQRATIAAQQEQDRDDAWAWLVAALTSLAVSRMFDPSVDAPALGEFDPSLAAPPGLVRQALARAGGLEGLITRGADGGWAVLADGGRSPAGGPAAGSLLLGALRDGGAGLQGYTWDYGPAFRKNPFEPHLRLDGQPFVNFDDPALASDGTFGSAFWMPGDHGSCRCTAVPAIIPPTD